MDKIQWFCEYVIPECLRNSNLAKETRTFVNFVFDDCPLKDGFASNTVSGRIICADKHAEQGISVVLVIVKLMLDQNRRSTYVENVFTNEAFAYKHVIPFLGKLNPSIYDLFPRFYHLNLALRADNEEGCIVIENLSEGGYYPAKMKVTLDLDHLFLIVRKLGEFHSYSYQAKKKYPNQFYSMVDCLRETHYTSTKETQGYMKLLNEYYCSELLSEDRGRYFDAVERIRSVLDSPENFVSKVFATRQEPTAVLCHGDFLRNNVLVKYTNGLPTHVKFIDLANFRYCSPIVDLSLILYMNTDQETRRVYWDRLVDAYYDSLTSTFPDNDVVPSKEEIVREFKGNSLVVYIFAQFFVPMMMEMELNPDPDYLRKMFEEAFEGYEATSRMDVPGRVIAQIVYKLLDKPNRKDMVLDIIKDIIDRGYI